MEEMVNVMEVIIDNFISIVMVVFFAVGEVQANVFLVFLINLIPVVTPSLYRHFDAFNCYHYSTATKYFFDYLINGLMVHSMNHFHLDTAIIQILSGPIKFLVVFIFNQDLHAHVFALHFLFHFT